MADNIPPEDRLIVTRLDAKASGKKRYFTGDPCKHGHIAERFVSTTACVSCDREASKKYANSNREVMRIKQRARYAADPEKMRAKMAKHVAANLEKIKQRKRAWRMANIEKIRADAALMRAANREKIAAAATKWYFGPLHEKIKAERAAYARAHPKQQAAAKAARRARARKAEGKFSYADVVSLIEVQRKKCAHPWCKKSLSSGYHVDHIVPLCLGGSNDKKNIQILCPRCNLRKSGKHPTRVAKENGFLV